MAIETIPPLATAGSRHLIAGLVLFSWAGGWTACLTWREWRASLVVGVLFFLIGHGTLHWAELFVPTGIAALLIATEPLFVALLIAPASGPRFTPRIIGGLLAGLAGVALLVPPGSLRSEGMQLVGYGAILTGAFSWSLGIWYSNRAPLPRDAVLRAGTTLRCGAGLVLTASALSGELSLFAPGAVSVRSLAGLAYLILFGSIVAFSAYFWLLERRPARLVATHTFVNPVIAVFLGWLLAGEPINSRIVAATGLILAAVFLMQSDR